MSKTTNTKRSKNLVRFPDLLWSLPPTAGETYFRPVTERAENWLTLTIAPLLSRNQYAILRSNNRFLLHYAHRVGLVGKEVSMSRVTRGAVLKDQEVFVPHGNPLPVPSPSRPAQTPPFRRGANSQNATEHERHRARFSQMTVEQHQANYHYARWKVEQYRLHPPSDYKPMRPDELQALDSEDSDCPA